MGAYSSFSVRGWHVDGNNRITGYLSISEKECLQDLILDHGGDEYSSSHSQDDDVIIDFGDTSFHAFDDFEHDMLAFTEQYRDIMIECEYYGEDCDIHEIWRFKNGIYEYVAREEYYPPFSTLTLSTDDDREHDKMMSVEWLTNLIEANCYADKNEDAHGVELYKAACLIYDEWKKYKK